MIRVTPLRILVAGWIVFLLYAYPGYVDIASADMLAEARVGRFSDWHSPVMARIWWFLGLVVSGPPGMLVLQSALFLGGAYFLLRRGCTERLAAAIACGVLLFPPILAIEAIVCPQSLFAGFALAGVALLTSPRPRRKLGGLAMLLVAAGLHPGATFAVLPLVLFGFRWRDDLPRVRSLALATAAWAVIAVGAYGLERSIIDDVSYRRELQLAKDDLRGILHQTRTDDEAVRALLKVSGEDAAERTALFETCRAAIRANKGAYVKHRLRHLRQLLRANSKLYTQFTEIPAHADSISYRARHSLIQRAVIAPVRVISHTPVFSPMLYFLGAIGLLVFAIVRRHAEAAMFVTSALLYELAAAFFTTTTELRQSHWLVTATVFGAALFLVKLRHREDRAHRPLEVDPDRPAVPVE